jgi:hypothetical protein
MTFEQRVISMKLLSATKIEVLQEFANGLGTMEIAASQDPDVARQPRKSLSESGYVTAQGIAIRLCAGLGLELSCACEPPIGMKAHL